MFVFNTRVSSEVHGSQMSIFGEYWQGREVAEEIGREVELAQTFAPFQVFDLLDTVQRQVQIFQTFHSTHIFDFEDQIILK